MKKILHIINGLDLGGAETAIYRLLNTMQDHDYVFNIIVLSKPSYYSEQIENLGVPIHYLCIEKTNLIKALFRLIILIRKIKPDIVQTWLYHSDFIGSICAKLCGVKKIIWSIRCEGAHLKTTTKWVKYGCAVLSWIIPDFILNNSQAGLRHHIRIGYYAKKMRLIHNGFDTKLFAPIDNNCLIPTIIPSLPTNAVLMGTLARFHEDKDYLNLIQAIDPVCLLYPNVYFIFCGQGCDTDNAQLDAMLKTLAYRDRVILVGRTDHAAIYLNQLDVFILSSKTEGFPNCLAEAMACGLPCITTDVGESRNLLSDTGFIVPRNDSKELATACLTMLEKSQDERRQYGIAARQRIEEYYSIAHHTSQMQALYDL